MYMRAIDIRLLSLARIERRAASTFDTKRKKTNTMIYIPFECRSRMWHTAVVDFGIAVIPPTMIKIKKYNRSVSNLNESKKKIIMSSFANRLRRSRTVVHNNL